MSGDSLSGVDWLVVAAVIVGVLSTARITRLVTQDDFPPSVRLRAWWDKVTNDGEWSKLVHCHWCFSPYAAWPVLATALIFDLHPAWWIVNGWLAGAYVASMVVERDEGAS